MTTPADGDPARAFDAFEARGWQESAASYDEFFAPISRSVVPTLLREAEVGAGDRLLDVACGPGYVSGAAANLGASPVGLDIAPAMVELARRRLPGRTLCVADAQAVPFGDGTFDRVVANLAIMHLARPERAVGEWVRVLRPGGRLAFSSWDLPQSSRLAGLFTDAMADAGVSATGDLPEGPSFFRFASDDERHAILRPHGLDEIRSTVAAFGLDVRDADELWDGVMAGTVRVSGAVAGLPGVARAAVRRAFDRLVEAHRSDEGYTIPVSVRVTSARKPDRR